MLLWWRGALHCLSLNRSLMAAGLVDRIEVTIFPVISGRTGTSPILAGAGSRFQFPPLTRLVQPQSPVMGRTSLGRRRWSACRASVRSSG